MTLDLDFTYIVVLASFLVPLLILNGIVIGPFLRLFEERHEKLEGALDRAEEKLEQAARSAATFDERMKVATDAGLEKRAAVRAEATAKMNARIEEERLKVQAKLKSALEQIQSQREQAMGDINAQAEQLAEATANKLLGRTA